MAEFETFEAHGHPRFDVCCLKYQTSVLDDCLEVRIEVFEDQVEVGLVREDVQELGGLKRHVSSHCTKDE